MKTFNNEIQLENCNIDLLNLWFPYIDVMKKKKKPHTSIPEIIKKLKENNNNK